MTQWEKFKLSYGPEGKTKVMEPNNTIAMQNFMKAYDLFLALVEEDLIPEDKILFIHELMYGDHEMTQLALTILESYEQQT